MRALQKLVRNGNSTAVAIPRPFLFKLNWVPGRSVIIELTENCDAVIVRLPREADFGVVSPPSLAYAPGTVKP
ncbi:MAG TPA: AbrB/MazE/SpoVT family DNA-binding domain-containing protein [Gemmatimonadales bacterium]|nr:AbrB/MazE/SpoVT family DNA-binding domain-containing protein [Gemmatimonadales bacterium]HLZ44709.1 AbrB/MazE/SpoVT family DNA-binding domain-containing protein [Gemmatimonadales bacterium]